MTTAILAISHNFHNPQLLSQALTHPSYASQHNERLEFLGDSVLGNIITHQLYLRFTTATEGQLSRLRANLVKKDTLMELAKKLHLEHSVRLGEGHLRVNGGHVGSVLANALEALIGAIYLDGGAIGAERFVLDLYHEKLNDLRLENIYKDPKSTLQELLQAKKLGLPNYQLVSIVGKPPSQVFTVECTVKGLSIGARGEGRSRRLAEQQGAEQVIMCWQKSA